MARQQRVGGRGGSVDTLDWYVKAFDLEMLTIVGGPEIASEHPSCLLPAGFSRTAAAPK
jgi:hypothetical protein